MSALSDGPHVNIVPKQAKIKRKPEPVVVAPSVAAAAVTTAEKPSPVVVAQTTPTPAVVADVPIVDVKSIETTPAVIGK